MNFCNKCGQRLDEKYMFCPHCNNDLYGITNKNLYIKDILKKIARILMYIVLGALIIEVLFLVIPILIGGLGLSIPYIINDSLFTYIGRLFSATILIGINILLIMVVNKATRNSESTSIGFKILVLIFSNLVSGILLIIADIKQKVKEDEKMQFCSKCGQELNENDVFCPNCGEVIADKKPKMLYEGNKTITVARVFMYIGVVAQALSIILYFIMAKAATDAVLSAQYYTNAVTNIIFTIVAICLLISFNRKVRDNEPMGIGFKIAVLLLCNLIAGICLLTVKTDSRN